MTLSKEDYSLTPFLEAEQTKENTMLAYKAGRRAGDERTAKRLREIIWGHIMISRIDGPEGFARLKKIVFGEKL